VAGSLIYLSKHGRFPTHAAEHMVKGLPLDELFEILSPTQGNGTRLSIREHAIGTFMQPAISRHVRGDRLKFQVARFPSTNAEVRQVGTSLVVPPFSCLLRQSSPFNYPWGTLWRNCCLKFQSFRQYL